MFARVYLNNPSKKIKRGKKKSNKPKKQQQQQSDNGSYAGDQWQYWNKKWNEERKD